MNCFLLISHIFHSYFFKIEVHFIYSRIREYHINGLMCFDRWLHLCHLPRHSISEEENTFLYQIQTQVFGYLTQETLGQNRLLFSMIIL